MNPATAKLSYQRLKHEPLFDHEDQDYYYRSILDKVIRKSRRSNLRKFHIRRKLRVKIPSLKKFLRRKARLVKVAWIKVYKRLKESQSHFGDLFAGNYLFMQVTPTPLNYADIYNNANKLSSSHLHGLSSAGYSIPRVA
ncbi:hypothetical protein PHJA_000642700 [Phtheirospermum japonicum]|uniref:Uncharacterized protein n=1 Tax=Phtheirospermum japonicum TaxID=374723 RepID=A0A830BHW1_9LAMI|nr:hypothetical protein PHJA_000642700 [Phtheirospermum japonicum]